MSGILVSMSSVGGMRIVILAALVSTMVPSIALLPHFGSTMSATAQSSASSATELRSDFNGDGYDDLAIGVPISGGSVHVLYGSSSGLQTSSPADQLWSSASPGTDATGQTFGESMAAGDYNGDGYSDIAAGVDQETVGGVHDAGGVNVIYGSSAGLRTSPASDGTGRTDQLWTQNSPGVEDQAEFFDLFGAIVASGNFNGDGYDDLAVTALDEDLPSGANAGVVHVLYGSSSGLQAFSPPDQFWTQNSPGRTLAISDFNGDGNDDLAIGASSEDMSDIGGAGVVHVLYGSTSGLQSSSPADQLWHQNSPGVNDFSEQNENFGTALAATDFNGDGYGDLAIGTENEEVGSKSGAGAVNVLYGSKNGLQTSSPADQFWHQNVAGVEETNQVGDGFGSALAASDYNGDGYGDLAVGVFGESVDDIGRAGAVNLIYGSSSGLQTTSPADQLWHQNSPGVEDVSEIKDFFGWVLSSGDFNGDGNSDLAVGVPREYIGILHFAGAVNVLYGSSSGITSLSDQFWHQDSPGVNGAADYSEYFGNSLSTTNKGVLGFN